MSQIKAKKQTKNTQSIVKNQWTKQKSKQSQNAKVEPQTTIAKNLLREFDEAQNKLNSSNKVKDKSEQSIDLTSNQQQHSQTISQIENSQYSNYTQPDQQFSLAVQLPRSYILAMKGLQEGVDSRDKEIRKIKKILKEQIAQLQQFESLKNQQKKAKQSLEVRLNQLTLQNKFLKQIIADLKVQISQQLKSRIQVQNQLKLSKEYGDKQSTQIQKIKRQCELLTSEKQNLKQEIQRISRYMNERKAQYDETTKKRNQQYAINFSQLSTLKLDCFKLKDHHEKDLIELNKLKNEVKILGESLILQQERSKAQALLLEKIHLDKLQVQMTNNRQMLRQITFNQNQLQRSISQSKREPEENKDQNSNNLKATFHQTYKSKPNYNASLEQRSSFQSRQPSIKIERSSSRMRQTNDSQHPQRREIIGQMRQLMRHEKELVSLNYQMQVLEKGMMSQNSVSKRQEMQRTYCKLRKNIERKEIQVKQLKHFLDNPLKGIK